MRLLHRPPRRTPRDDKRDPKAIRRPVVAGIFYPEEKKSLAELIDQVVGRPQRRERAFALLVPHGGYLSSAEVAGSVYSRVIWPGRVVVMGPSHTGVGKPFSLMKKGAWETPLGNLPVDEPLARAILKQAPELEEDPKAHELEHAIEVQIPFLQRVGGVKSFVPVLFQGGDAAAAQRIGEGIARAVAQIKEEVLLICTTDLTRYEPKQIAQENDRRAIEPILALDGPGLFKAVGDHSISMCGAMPAAATIAAAKSLGASRAELVKYQPYEGPGGEAIFVVGFSGIIFR
ncbi:MAG: AmmeMemoRadiSam system protein B [Candidatus Omnitrophica bacterium]|nr:AmmeMemoRadiSam system protein B [Candidatus Omnitrophota bacterium]